MKIADLITSEAKWTKDCLGRDKEGNAMNSFDGIYDAKYDKQGKIFYEEKHLDELAKSFSLHGAVIKCYSQDHRASVLGKLSKAIEQYTGKKKYIAQFNNEPTTSYEDVKAVIQIAGV